MSKNLPTFFAYSSYPQDIKECVNLAQGSVKAQHLFADVRTWEQMDVSGGFIADEVFAQIDSHDYFIADLSTLNFNVIYELGYAIGRGKKIRVVLNTAINSSFRQDINRVGIFDTIGYEKYENSNQLLDIFSNLEGAKHFPVTFSSNKDNPIYLVDAETQNDLISTIKSRVKKTGFPFRSFDPNEFPRMPGYDAIKYVAEAFCVVVPFLPDTYSNSSLHNYRAAFVAGLAQGMEKETLFLQLGEGPIPIDYRDLVTYVREPRDIIDAIADLAPRINNALYADDGIITEKKISLLEKVNLGASAAENEFKDLSSYYLETDAYRRALNGEVRIVLGRKGAGKTALFSQVRNKKRSNKQNIVIDLKPETYKLLKFKDEVLSLLEEGTLEHTIMAFWEYILYLELCYKVLEKDSKTHVHNHDLYEPYKELHELYHTDEYISEGDFSERLSTLLQNIKNDFIPFLKENHSTRLSRGQITELVYSHQIKKLRDCLINYLQSKEEVVILIDNLDKGWHTLGVRKEDLIILRTLFEASRKIENQLGNKDIPCNTIIFLRNDIYELLLSEVTDRGKETKISLDWQDAESLKELIRRRMVSTDDLGDIDKTSEFEEIWSKIAVSHVKGEKSLNYLLDRSLMRPRTLIELIRACRAVAVDRGHSIIEENDFFDGAINFSHTLIEDINLEIRDAYPQSEDIIYSFIAEKSTFSKDDLYTKFLEAGLEDEDDWEKLLSILLWYGVIGFYKNDSEQVYIYDVSYDMKGFQARIKKQESSNSLIFTINPAFWGALETSN